MGTWHWRGWRARGRRYCGTCGHRLEGAEVECCTGARLVPAAVREAWNADQRRLVAAMEKEGVRAAEAVMGELGWERRRLLESVRPIRSENAAICAPVLLVENAVGALLVLTARAAEAVRAGLGAGGVRRGWSGSEARGGGLRRSIRGPRASSEKE